MTIANNTILITGASRGIGRALVEEALRRGAKRMYTGTRGPLPHADGRVTPVTPDVTDATQIARAVAGIDTLDVLVNNAGVAIYDDLRKLEVIERHLDVNFLGLLRVTQAFLPLLKRTKGHRQPPLARSSCPVAGYTWLLPLQGGGAQPDAVAAGAARG